MRENIIAIEEIEVQRNPLIGRVIPATAPLELTADQQTALEQIVGKLGRALTEREFAGRGQGDTWAGQAPPLHDINQETAQE